MLEAASHFVKFVGYNTVIAQDVKGTIYYLNGSTLSLMHKTKTQFALMDAFGNKDFICLALTNKKLQFVSRKTFDVVKAINTQE